MAEDYSREDNSLPEEEAAGKELVSSIESELQQKFPDLKIRSEVIQTIENVVQEWSFSYSGPVPPPQMLAAYDRICPGSAIRLLNQGIEEQAAKSAQIKEHLAQQRIVIEGAREDLRSFRKFEQRGQIFGFISFCIIAALGGFAIYLQQTAVAITCFTTFALGVVGLFLTGCSRRHSSGDQEEKDK